MLGNVHFLFFPITNNSCVDDVKSQMNCQYGMHLLVYVRLLLKCQSSVLIDDLGGDLLY